MHSTRCISGWRCACSAEQEAEGDLLGAAVDGDAGEVHRLGPDADAAYSRHPEREGWECSHPGQAGHPGQERGEDLHFGPRLERRCAEGVYQEPPPVLLVARPRQVLKALRR